MKKTIAKIMAAAMVLSAVPAVAMPSLTAEAASVEKIEVDGISSKTVDLAADGSTGITVTVVTPSTGASASDAFKSGTYVTNTTTGYSNEGFEIVFGSSVTNDQKAALNGKLTASIDSKGKLKVVASEGASETIRTLVANSTNTFELYGYTDGVKAAVDDEGTSVLDSGEIDFGNFRIGGTKDITSTVVYTATDVAGTIVAGEIGVKVDTSGNAEILKGTSNIADNDALRGQTLELNEVLVSGATYPVTKVGAQALKEAHMKKLDIENTKTIGKGALRKCKQVTKIDASDSNKVRKIHSKAFYGDKNLKNIIIDGRKLNTVGSNAFSGVKKNCVVKIKAKKSKYNSDVKLIKKNGGNKNLKFKRVAP
ncbi:MAG: leucine-rich repeat protein [Lachnospiraceae bacterium]|nr:leucine-rich repeat protein [Lachnospiraceae bacterium]